MSESPQEDNIFIIIQKRKKNGSTTLYLMYTATIYKKNA